MASILTKKKGEYTLKELNSLGQVLLSSRNAEILTLSSRNAKILALLISFISPESELQFVEKSLHYLRSFFTPRISQLPSTSSHPSSTKCPRSEDGDDSSKTKITEAKDPDVTFKASLRSNFDEFVKILLNFFVSKQSIDTLRGTVFEILMEFEKFPNVGRSPFSIYHRLLQAIIHSAIDIDIFLNILASNYFKYIDVHYFTYISMEKFVKTLEASVLSANNKTVIKNSELESGSKESLEHSVRKIYQVLSRIPPPEKQARNSQHNMWSCSDGSSSGKPTYKKINLKEQDSSLLSPTTIAKEMKLEFTKAWISFLRLPLPPDVYEEVLGSVHQTVIPHLSEPAMLRDFLTKSYDVGGVVSMMALSTLFILMTKHGLEYPNFYDQLSALLVPSVFVGKHRARFLQLLDDCLKSSLLPAYVAASLTKKLSRLSLSVPPSESLVIMALIYNLLQRHPSINHLAGTHENANEAIEHNDSQPEESDPMKSFFWEMDTLRHHYYPPVSRFVSSLETDLTIRSNTTEKKIEDFSSGSYATIFGEEMERKSLQVPLAFYETVPTSLFEESDFPGWTFTIPQEDSKC